MTEEKKYVIPMTEKEWKPPKIRVEFLWIENREFPRQVDLTFRCTKNVEVAAVGDDLYENAAYRMVTLVFRETKPKPARRAFSLKKEWEITAKGEATLDSVVNQKLESLSDRRK